MKTGKKAMFDEINITPLTDIFLVLLIIMMVVAPMMQQSRADISPPGLSSGSAIKQGLLTVEVTNKGEYFVDGQQVPEANLTQILTEKKPQNVEKDTTVMIRADKTAKSAATLAIMSAAREARYDKVTVAGQNLSETRQQVLTTTPTTENTATEMTP